MFMSEISLTFSAVGRTGNIQHPFLFPENKKPIDIFEDSPPRTKPKLQVGPVGVSSRYQGKKERDEKASWDELEDKRLLYSKDDMKKNNSDRRKNLQMSPNDRIPLPMEKPKSPPLPPPPSEVPIKTAVDKFSFRVKVIDPPLVKGENDVRKTKFFQRNVSH